MPSCCIKSCNIASRNKYYSLFTFPSIDKRSERCTALSIKRRNYWMTALGLTNLDNCNHLRICERHFISGVKSELLDEHNVDWVPSQNLPEVDPFFGIQDVAGSVTVKVEESEDVEDTAETLCVDAFHRTIATQTDVSITGTSGKLFLEYEKKIRLLEYELSQKLIKVDNYQTDEDI